MPELNCRRLAKRKVISGLITTLLIFIGLPNTASASDYMGYIKDIVQVGSHAYVYVVNGWFGADNCGSGRSALIVSIDTTTSDGKSFIALALNAKAMATQVYVAGKADCTTDSTPNGDVSESISVMWLH